MTGGIIRKIREKLREGGPRLLLSLLARNAAHWLAVRQDRHFDRRYGVETVDPIHRPDLKISHRHGQFGTSYHPTVVSALKRIFGELPVDPRGYQFIEFGSGKGRVLLWAARSPFARVTGIEYSRTLCDIAEENVRRVAGNQEFKSPIDIVCQDATETRIPSVQCVFYFYNPFSDEIAASVLKNIAAARETAPRPDVIVWYPAPSGAGRILPESFGFHVHKHVIVRDYLGAERDVYIMVRTQS